MFSLPKRKTTQENEKNYGAKTMLGLTSAPDKKQRDNITQMVDNVESDFNKLTKYENENDEKQWEAEYEPLEHAKVDTFEKKKNKEDNKRNKKLEKYRKIFNDKQGSVELYKNLLPQIEEIIKEATKYNLQTESMAMMNHILRTRKLISRNMEDNDSYAMLDEEQKLAKRIEHMTHEFILLTTIYIDEPEKAAKAEAEKAAKAEAEESEESEESDKSKEESDKSEESKEESKSGFMGLFENKTEEGDNTEGKEDNTEGDNTEGKEDNTEGDNTGKEGAQGGKKKKTKKKKKSNKKKTAKKRKSNRKSKKSRR